VQFSANPSSSQRLLELVLAASPTPLAVLDARHGGRLRALNRPFALLCGYERVEMLRDQPLALLLQAAAPTPSPLRPALQQVAQALRARQPLECTTTLPDSANRPRPLRLTLTPVETEANDDEGEQSLSLLSLHDEALPLSHVLDAALLSRIAHEVRAPLNTVNGFLDLVLSLTEDEELRADGAADLRHYLRRARAGSEYLYALLENLFCLVRAESGHLHLRRDSPRLREIVEAAIGDLEYTAALGQVAVKPEVPPDLTLMEVDALRLQQVLRNLLINALHFTPSGGQVMISAMAATPGRVIVSVRDSGVGIAPEHLPHVFERFYRVPPPTGLGRSGGMGLGLTVARLLTELQGGVISLQSRPGLGTTVSFSLPLLIRESAGP
jgi:signal transduction histidine kinase